MSDPWKMRAPSGSHEDRHLDRDGLLDDPIDLFRRWLADAELAEVPLPNAMAVATADAFGRPSVRHVLLRGVDHRGFQFYTNRESRKAHQLAENPWAAMVFLWKELDRQVHVAGPVSLVSDEESDAYFAGRPRDAQLGAWASAQSTVIAGRDELDRRMEEMSARFPGEVPRPPHWGGYRVRATTVEFWQGRRHRLHDRFLYTEVSSGRTADERNRSWTIERLAP